jgi:hypothetical protein
MTNSSLHDDAIAPLVAASGHPLDLDKGVAELYVDANFSIGPFVWQFELVQDVTEVYVEANFFHRTNPLAIRIMPLRH